MRRERRPRRAGVGTRPASSYERKLIAALRSPLPDRQLLAARVLGQIGCRAAIPALRSLSQERTDPYLAAECARALASLDPDSPAVVRLASRGPALVRDAIREALRGPR